MGHGSHGSHSNHSSTSNKDAHSNSISSGSISTASANPHSATIGGVDWSGSFNKNGKISVYGSTGSLSQFVNIVNSMRDRPKNSTYADNTGLNSAGNGGSIPSSGSIINSSAVQNLVNYGGSQYNTRYQPFTLNMNITSSTNGSSGSTGPVSATKTQDISGNVNTSTKSWTSTVVGNYKGLTASYTFTDDLSGQAIRSSATASATASLPASGTKITKKDAAKILAALQNETLSSWKGPDSATYSWNGYNNMVHSVHTVHVSHSSCKKEFKENIKKFTESALDLIKSIDIVEFNYTKDAVFNGIGDDSEIKHIGFIADDTIEELSTKYHDRMDYINCIGILIKSIQELNDKIDKLDVK